MIEKAQELKAYIQQNNITDRFGLENAVKFYTQDSPVVHRILNACVHHNVLANFLAERKIKTQVKKPFVQRYSTVLKQQSDLSAAEIKQAMLLCLYISNFVTKEDIQKRLNKGVNKAPDTPAPPKKKPAQQAPITPVNEIPLPPSKSKDEQEVDEVQTIIGFKFDDKDAPDKSSLSPLFPIKTPASKPAVVPANPKEDPTTIVRKSSTAPASVTAQKSVKSKPKAVEKAKPVIQKKPSHTKKKAGGFLRTLLLLLLLPFLYFLYAFVYPYLSDQFFAQPTYCIATGLKIRAQPTDSSERLGGVVFGDELKFYGEADNAPGWICVKGDGQKGYVKAKYVADKRYARELGAILGDADALYSTGLTRNRKALKSYFDTQGYCGLMSATLEAELYGDTPPNCSERWQIFAKDHTSSLSLRMRTESTSEYAALLTRVDKHPEKKLVVLSFEGNAEQPEGFLELDLPGDVEEIAIAKAATKKWKVSQNDSDSKKQLARDGIYFETEEETGNTARYLVILEAGNLEMIRQ